MLPAHSANIASRRAPPTEWKQCRDACGHVPQQFMHSKICLRYAYCYLQNAHLDARIQYRGVELEEESPDHDTSTEYACFQLTAQEAITAASLTMCTKWRDLISPGDPRKSSLLRSSIHTRRERERAPSSKNKRKKT